MNTYCRHTGFPLNDFIAVQWLLRVRTVAQFPGTETQGEGDLHRRDQILQHHKRLLGTKIKKHVLIFGIIVCHIYCIFGISS